MLQHIFIYMKQREILHFFLEARVTLITIMTTLLIISEVEQVVQPNTQSLMPQVLD
jgi:hypothetical protein